MLDLEALLKPATSEPPSGPNLQYRPEYANLERAAAGKAERQVGGVVVAAEPPEWRDVIVQCPALLAKSKDLRIALTFTRALLEVRGFEGLADGLALVRGLVDQFWDGFHPQLDADDGNDPTARISAMASLTHRDMLMAIRGAPVVTSRVLGAITLRTLDGALARGSAKTRESPADAAPPAQNGQPSAATVEAIFQDAGLEALTLATAALTRCSQQAAALAEAWGRNLPAGGPDFTELRRVLGQAEQAVAGRLATLQGAAKPASEPGDATGRAGAAPPAAAFSGQVRSRDDVIRAIDAICAYYAREEPSSPLPLLLQRGRRLVAMSFTNILKELLPDAIPSLEKLAGKTDE